MGNNISKFETGPDGVAQIYGDKKGGTQVYMGNKQDFDDSIFNVSFGKGSHIDYDSKKQGSLHYWTTEGSPINYNSGAKSGRSTRIDTYPGKGMWKNDTDYYWKDNPGYLYNEKGTLNSEFTTYIRVGKALGTHQAYAHKIAGRDEDELRSLFEMVYPTSGKNKILGHYNYAHFPYVAVTPKNFQQLDQFGDDWGWLAMKTIHWVVGKGDDKTAHWEVWGDMDPVDDNGVIKNNWIKLAEYEDEGCDEYGNVPVTWKCHKQVCRIDGFKSVDFALFSDREIDPEVMTSKIKIQDRKPINNQSKPQVDPGHDDNSIEDFANAMKWLSANKDTKIGDIISAILNKNKPATSTPQAPQPAEDDSNNNNNNNNN